MLLVAVWVIALGCGPQAREPMRMMAKQRPYFSDVPIPMGFQIIEKASEDSMTGKRRVYVRHVYEGRADPYAVRDFYIERMPQYKWQMVNAGQVEGIHTMRFVKAQESCTLTIQRSKSAWGGTVRIQLLIMQEERGTQADRKRAS